MANTTNFGWETPDDTDLVKDGALAMRTLGNAIDTSLVDLKGGTTGQVLSKNTNTDMDFVWTTPNVGDITEVQAGTGISIASGTGPIPVVTNTVATTFDAKADLVVGTGADTFAKLTVGANNTVLTADSTTATGLKWAAPAGGGDLVLITTVSPSAVSSQSINDCFSSTYRNYRILLDLTGSQADELSIRLRASGSDDSGSNYTWQRNTAGGSSTSPLGETGTSFSIGASGTTKAIFSVDMFAPQLAERTGYITIGGRNNFGGMWFGNHSQNTAYTGFTVLIAGGTFTGKISVYGYKE